VPLVIYIAIDTGMRRKEIFDLTWKDVDRAKRRIIIRKSKSDWQTGKTNVPIVLPLNAKLLLDFLLVRQQRDETFSPDGPLFPMTAEAFGQAFSEVVARAKKLGLKDHIQFRDLRRTANTRFIA